MGWIIIYPKPGEGGKPVVLGEIDPKQDFEGLTKQGRKLNNADANKAAAADKGGRS